MIYYRKLPVRPGGWMRFASVHSVRDMRRAKQLRCDAIILALDRRLQAFYHAGKLHSYLAEPPYLSLLSTISSLTGGVIVLASDGKLPIPMRCRKSMRHVHLRNVKSNGITGVLGELSRARLKTNRVLIVDASAPFIEADTLVALLKSLKTADVAGLGGNGGAVAIKAMRSQRCGPTSGPVLPLIFGSGLHAPSRQDRAPEDLQGRGTLLVRAADDQLVPGLQGG